MAPRGGYKKGVDVNAEYVRLDRRTNAKANIMAEQMGQPLEVWIEDAAQFHLYYCERFLAKERYRADEMEAQANREHTPDPLSPKYQVDRPAPTITRTPGQGSGPTGRNYRP